MAVVDLGFTGPSRPAKDYRLLSVTDGDTPDIAMPVRMVACPDRRRTTGFDYVHSAVDDHSRLAYSEVHADEKAATCAAFLRRAAAFFAAFGISRIERVLTDNAWAYRKSSAWREALADLGAVGKLTRIYRPQPTARSNASTEPCSRSGPTCGPTPATTNAPPP